MTPDDLRPDTDEIGAPELPPWGSANGTRFCPEGWHDVAQCWSLTEDPRKDGGDHDDR